nr:uncharacterized protein LOC105466395 [Macaca nemestrina]
MLGRRRQLGARNGRGERGIAHTEDPALQNCRRRGLRGRQAGPPGRRRGSGAQVPGSGIAARPRRSAPRLGPHSLHPRPQAAVAARHPRSSAEDPLPLAGAFVPLTDPLHRAGQRGSSRGAPASSRLRSHAQVSITLKVGATLGGGAGPSATSSPPPARGLPHLAGKLTSALSAAGCRTRSKPPNRAKSLRGLQGAPACLGAGASRGWPEGVGPQKSQQFSTPSDNAAGERGGEGRAPYHPPLARSGCAARPAPPGAKRRVSQLADAVTPPLRHREPHSP